MNGLSKESSLVREFMDRGMHITPKALKVILDLEKTDVDRVLNDLGEREDRPPVVNDEVVSQILSSEEAIPSTAPKPRFGNQEKSPESEKTGSGSTSGRSLDKSSRKHRGEQLEEDGKEEGGPEVAGKAKILRDITGVSMSEGMVGDFVQLFRDRYEKLKRILKSRERFQNYTKLENVVRHEGDVVNLIGIVGNRRETRKSDAWLIELEDTTGEVVVYIKDSERNEKVIDKVKGVVTDEVIGVRAKVPNNLKSGNRSPLVWGNEIFWPDIPTSTSSPGVQGKLEDSLGYAVLISDLHVGSSMFMEDVFERFLDWMNGEAGNKKQREMAGEVKYLLIAGDLVDGIGIYPGQQKELEIEDVWDQYIKVAEYLSRVPNDVEIIAAPGNHDAVRLAEPQPALNTEVASPLRDVDVRLVGNPALLSIEGLKFLMYHGMGFDDLVSSVSYLDRDNVVAPMEELLRRRHLAPIYGSPMGGKTPIAPEKEDYLVIDEVPDVLHCGHLHKYGCGEYRGVLMINSATFQKQTIFMKRQGISPTPGHVPIVDLQKKEVKAINFA